VALFEGEDLVTITTPDGRTMQLPRSIARSLMPQAPAMQQIGQTPGPAPMGFADEPLATGPADPPSLTGGSLEQVQDPSMQLAPAPERVAPDEYKAAEVAIPAWQEAGATPGQTERGIAASNKAYDKKQNQQAAAQKAYQFSARGRMDSANTQQQNAFDAEQNAVLGASTVEAAAQDLLGEITGQHNERLSVLQDKKNAAALEGQRRLETKTAEKVALRKKIAGTKIDRTSDHPIINALGMALVNIGAAMNGDKSAPGLEIVWKAIDRKVAAQMADLDQMEKTYGMVRDELGDIKSATDRTLEMHAAMFAGEADKAKRHLEEVVAKSSSAKVKAQAKVYISQIDQRAAAEMMKSVQWGLDYDQKDRAEKGQNARHGASLHQADRHHNDDVALKREEMYLNYTKALAATKASGDESRYKLEQEMIKDNDQLGIVNPITKENLLTPKGMVLRKEASKLEEEAAALEKNADPAKAEAAATKAAMLREKAQIIRGNADMYHTVKGRNGDSADKLSNAYGAAQNITSLVDDIKGLAERSYVSTDAKRAAVQAKMQLLKLSLKEATQAGAWDKGLDTLMTSILGGDPTKGMDPDIMIGKLTDGLIGTASEGYKSRLDAVVDDMQNTVLLKVGGRKYGGTKEDMFFRKSAPANSPEAKASARMSQEKTPLEREADAQPSTASNVRDNIYAGPSKVAEILSFGKIKLDSTPRHEQLEKEAQNSGSVLRPGFSEKQATDFDTLVTSHKEGKRGAGNLLVAQVVNNANARPELAYATLKNLKQYAPELYKQASVAIPKDSKLAEQVDYEEKTQLGMARIETPMLIQQYYATGGTDPEINAHLARRATSGDKDALKVFRDKALNTRRDGTVAPPAAPPAGSASEAWQRGGR
jgi:hypothetical protein